MLRKLDEGLLGKMTLVSAPAGYGKSSLVSSWLSHIESSNESSTKIFSKGSWLSLCEHDDDIPSFIVRLVSAIQHSMPEYCQEVVQLIQASPVPDIETLANSMVQSLVRLPHRLVLVLDDLHQVSDAAIHALLARLVEYTPPQLHLVLVSRVDPPLMLNRWRAKGILNEIRLHDLAFTLAETTAFLCSNLDVEPDTSLIEMLQKRTEGWIVGLRLATVALRGQSDYGDFAARFATTNTRYIADYLVDEVLNRQTAHIQEFLVCTAVLDRLSAELCAAVLDISKDEARQHIEHLERENAFLVAMGPTLRWYRYHQQFRDMLLSRLHTLRAMANP
ncbi:MAG: AAA family ATPase, partial [Anaerolineae bacterium]